MYAFKVLTISSLNGQLPKDELKINCEAIKFCLIQHFEADFLCGSVESQPQNLECRNNSENLHPCLHQLLKIGVMLSARTQQACAFWDISMLPGLFGNKIRPQSFLPFNSEKSKFSNCFEREDHIYITAYSLNKTRHIYIFGEVLKGKPLSHGQINMVMV